jgi:predicted aspartyl protease
LDCGADRTIVPRDFVDGLQLTPLRELPVAGLGGDVQKLETFLANIQIRHLPPLAIEVLAHAGESYVLLGRDALNQLRVVLDGPNQVVEIG